MLFPLVSQAGAAASQAIAAASTPIKRKSRITQRITRLRGKSCGSKSTKGRSAPAPRPKKAKLEEDLMAELFTADSAQPEQAHADHCHGRGLRRFGIRLRRIGE